MHFMQGMRVEQGHQTWNPHFWSREPSLSIGSGTKPICHYHEYSGESYAEPRRPHWATETDGAWELHQFSAESSKNKNIETRDGSYGLLRRPIRYNTLLIRNTRIIRKRIYAILGGTLGLHKPPSNHHELSPQPPEHYNASW